MTITWFGHSCFRVEAKGVNILFDPFSKEIGLRPPRIRDDIILVSHEHYDHNATDGADGETFIIRNPGEYERKGVAIQGIRAFHDKKEGAERGMSTIYRVRVEDVTLCHLGDFGQAELSTEQIEAIGDVDVLFVPVGGTYTIDGKEAAAIVSAIEPKIIIPMHYAVDGLSIPSLDGPERFLKEVGLSPDKGETLRVTAKDLPVDETKLFVFTL